VNINLLSDEALDAVSGGLDMNPATSGSGHYSPGQKLPPAPAAAPGTEGNGPGLGPVLWGGAAKPRRPPRLAASTFIAGVRTKTTHSVHGNVSSNA
jgi:hypothetical protein